MSLLNIIEAAVSAALEIVMIEECKCLDHPDHSPHVSQDGCGGAGGGENRDHLSYLHSHF